MQVSRLEAELKKEKEAKARIMRTRTTSPDPAREDTCSSLMMSEELESLKMQLAVEVQEKETLQQEMSGLKQSLVVSGKKDIVERHKVISDLQAEVCELDKALKEKDSDMKRQYQVHSHTIADLQTKLSKERQNREELLQSAKKESESPRPASSEVTTASRDTAAMTAAMTASMTATLQEKDKTIEQLTQQMQAFGKTARNVAKLTEHTKQQSETIVALKADLQQAQVHCTCTCTCMY